MNSHEIEALVTEAFRYARLGGGVSLRQAEARDDSGRGVTAEQFQALPAGEVTDDWAALTLDDLERYPYLAHLDAAGFRYYLPAFLLSVLEHYDPASLRVIGTLSALYPKRDDRWEHHMGHYSLLDRGQRATIAVYLRGLPSLVPLDVEDEKVVGRALRNYWHEYL